MFRKSSGSINDYMCVIIFVFVDGILFLHGQKKKRNGNRRSAGPRPPTEVGVGSFDGILSELESPIYAFPRFWISDFSMAIQVALRACGPPVRFVDMSLI